MLLSFPAHQKLCLLSQQKATSYVKVRQAGQRVKNFRFSLLTSANRNPSAHLADATALSEARRATVGFHLEAAERKLKNWCPLRLG